MNSDELLRLFFAERPAHEAYSLTAARARELCPRSGRRGGLPHGAEKPPQAPLEPILPKGLACNLLPGYNVCQSC